MTVKQLRKLLIPYGDELPVYVCVNPGTDIDVRWVSIKEVHFEGSFHNGPRRYPVIALITSSKL